MISRHSKVFQASLLIAASGILYGFLGLLGTHILNDHISISTMLFWRFLIAGGWILIFIIKKNATQRLLPLDKRTLFAMFILGAVGYAGSSAFYFMASQYTGTGLAMIIFFTYPIMVALSSWMIHKRNFSFMTVFILIMMMLGLFLLTDTSSYQFDVLGIFLGVIAALCYAFYVVGSKQVASLSIDSNILTTMVCFGCAFIFLILSLTSHSFAFPRSVNTWIHLLALGILATALPIQLMLEGLKYVSSMRASIISVLEPLVTLFVGILLLDESISHLQLIGTVIILGSALLAQFQREL